MSDKHPPEDLVESWATTPIEISVLREYPGSDQLAPNRTFPRVGQKPFVIILHPAVTLPEEFLEGSAVMQFAYSCRKPVVDPFLIEKLLELMGFDLSTVEKLFISQRIVVLDTEKIVVGKPYEAVK
jgi:hypothetical protein